jgi:hypothetical protein
MSKAKFTPGPWLPHYAYNDDGLVSLFVGLAKEATRADMKLIAAATELYEVVEKLVKWNEEYPSTRVYGYGDIKQIAEKMDVLNAQANAALAKARGEA